MKTLLVPATWQTLLIGSPLYHKHPKILDKISQERKQAGEEGSRVHPCLNLQGEISRSRKQRETEQRGGGGLMSLVLEVTG